MLLHASEQHDLDLSKCVVTGDVGDTDMLAAYAVGATKIMVKTGWRESSLTKFRDRWSETEPDYIAEHILDAVRWIIRGPE
ncbi:HAD hydrolase-like protein [Paenibacillus pabuli]|uniref:HAD hydrolase-like protein n=1 Tax=Paenibacillus pabuli TaxID=1472 RepID=UPI003CFA07ED